MRRTLLAACFDRLGGGRGLFTPQGPSTVSAPSEVVVLTPGAIPTTDLYLRGRLEAHYRVPVRYVDTLGTPPGTLSCGDGALVVIVRYLPPGWLRWLAQRRPGAARIVLLMDDDIPAAVRAPELPLRYAVKTAWRYALGRRTLKRVCSEVWVSTPALARRYAHARPRLWAPGYVEAAADGQTAGVYFYHGSWAHRREIAWLVPVVAAVQRRLPGAWFEIIGTDRVRRLFRGIPRVRVVHPMPWHDYLAHAATVRYAVGLAPCLASDFNAARSHSKVFDITRLGAAGIYAKVRPYAQTVVHGETGLLCAHEPARWVAAITLLLADRPLRDRLYAKARAAFARDASPPDLLER